MNCFPYYTDDVRLGDIIFPPSKRKEKKKYIIEILQVAKIKSKKGKDLFDINAREIFTKEFAYNPQGEEIRFSANKVCLVGRMKKKELLIFLNKEVVEEYW